MKEAYLNGAKAKSKNGEEQMCKITNILPDNSATWIWDFQTLANGCGPALFWNLSFMKFDKYQKLWKNFDTSKTRHFRSGAPMSLHLLDLVIVLKIDSPI